MFVDLNHLFFLINLILIRASIFLVNLYLSIHRLSRGQDKLLWNVNEGLSAIMMRFPLIQHALARLE